MKTGIFRGFGIPSFGILDMWWVVTPNGTPSELMLYWFAVKLFFRVSSAQDTEKVQFWSWLRPR